MRGSVKSACGLMVAGLTATALLLPAGAAGATFSNATPIALPNTGMTANPSPATAPNYPSSIVVSGLVGAVQDVNVTFPSLTHAAPSNLDALLTGPGGQEVLLMSDACDTTDIAAEAFTFNDEAAMMLPTAASCVGLSGSYKPSDYMGVEGADDLFDPPAPPYPYSLTLSAFDGGSPNGTWSLYASQDGDNAGMLGQGWQLVLSGPFDQPPPPSPSPSPSPGSLGSTASTIAACRSATIVGTDGSDVLAGTPGNDVIDARGGNDRIGGQKGSDIICAGAGKDKVNGGRGRDRLFGEGGKDKMRGGPGRDKMLGARGKDNMKGGPGRDKILGQKGRDRMAGGGATDVCKGGPGKDKATGCEKLRTI